MRKLLISLVFLVCFPTYGQGATYTAASCSESAVQAAITAELATPADGDIIAIPACPSGTAWTGTTPITVTFTTSVTIQGAGAVYSNAGGSSTSGTDSTVIIDNLNYSGGPNYALQFTVNSPKTLRITGLAWEQNSSSKVPNVGMWNFQGSTTGLRVDHLHFVITQSGTVGMQLTGSVIGVADHNFTEGTLGIICYPYLMRNGLGWSGHSSDQYGDYSWNDTDHWGTNEFFYVEDNRITASSVSDCGWGGRYVVRYSTITNTLTSGMPSGQIFSHGLEDGRTRGCRAVEVYNNVFDQATSYYGYAVSNNGGAELVWGNSVTNYNAAVQMASQRNDNTVYTQNPAPAGWGYCGPAPYNTGHTLSAAANSTSVTGTGFSTGWPSGTVLAVTGASCPWDKGGTVPSCFISSVSSSTSLTWQSASTSALSGASYTAGSPWDGNATAYGYPCMDGGGRGAGDLLSGDFPSVVNVTQGNIVAWPNQALDPVYVWDNSLSSTGSVLSPIAMYTDNKDYYQQFGTGGESGTFNGTKGVGQGLYAAITSTCTPGVGYWATDQNKLYVCGPSANSWTAYYSPYTYPYPVSGIVDNPTTSPAAGAYTSPQTITLADATSGATICYTTDGSTPTTNGAGACNYGLTYSSPFSLALPATVKAIGTKSGLADSSVISTVYSLTTIQAPTNLSIIIVGP